VTASADRISPLVHPLAHSTATGREDNTTAHGHRLRARLRTAIEPTRVMSNVGAGPNGYVWTGSSGRRGGALAPLEVLTAAEPTRYTESAAGLEGPMSGSDARGTLRMTGAPP